MSGMSVSLRVLFQTLISLIKLISRGDGVVYNLDGKLDSKSSLDGVRNHQNQICVRNQGNQDGVRIHDI